MSPHSRHLLPLLCAFLLLLNPRSASKELRASTDTTAPIQAVDAAAQSAGANANWWQTVSAQIARDEYHATSTPDGLQAPNRAHGLRTMFRTEGIDVEPRQKSSIGDDMWRFSWSTTRWGREGNMRIVEPAVPRAEAEGARVLYPRPGFDEWYENTAAGLEQGFTIHDPWVAVCYFSSASFGVRCTLSYEEMARRT